MTFASCFKAQGNSEFAALFGTIFPLGADPAKVKRFIDYRRAIEARLYTFQLNERFQIACYCSNCKRQAFVPVWDIAVALETKSLVRCTCGTGSLLPARKGKACEDISA